MAEPLIIKALQDKRAEVHGRINAYQAQIAAAKHDLAHINAAIRLFTDEDGQRVRYLVSHGFFKKGEIADIAVRHLEVDRELTTREVAERVLVRMVEKRKGMCIWSIAEAISLRPANSLSSSD